MTIGEREGQLRDALLIAVETNPDLTWLVPDGWVPVVQLREGGRKKRADARGEYWAPDTGEIYITFAKLGERVKETLTKRAEETTPVLTRPATDTQNHNTWESREADVPAARGPVMESVTPEVRELLSYLQSAENQAKEKNLPWVSLTWFRDHFISPSAVWYERRMEVLSHCLGVGYIEKGKGENPKNPAWPVTTIHVSASGKRILGIS
jgi:hypothetical protein